ncbi:PilZ domain-containing protein [Sphingomonas sp. G-3-2-10]|uniref:PilZ domain-containing protein n=1 Tax=Sphingomonas sp. G-3-2-10 TaxID=2728838 RepID=UPI00146B561E|nr:PilZ domain-containing protein [Sphingomonas sp. G-3-2-10]NML04544.1 PilZ domain-containing protein [Sphingomonas sp. G-3-2-10]
MPEARINRNQDKRESVMMRAVVWSPGARLPTEHRIRNLSISGACLSHQGQLRRGDDLRVSIGQALDVPAIVMWATPDAAGIRFDYPMDLAAARRRGASHMPARTGWVGDMNDAYRK